MNYTCRVNVTKEFRINFPEELFTEEHMEAIKSYSFYFSDMETPDDLKKEIIEAYAVGGNGYYEQFGAYIGWNEFESKSYGGLFIRVTDEDFDVEDSYLEQS